MTDRLDSLPAFLLLIGLIVLVSFAPQASTPQAPTPQSGISVADSAFDALPPSAAGAALVPVQAPTPQTENYSQGTDTSGGNAALYIEAAKNLLPALDQGRQPLSYEPEYWTYVQLPALLAKDAGGGRVLLNRGEALVLSGFSGESKLAQKHIARVLPERQIPRAIIEPLAGSSEMKKVVDGNGSD